MIEKLPPVRRLVTGINENGHSVITEDGDAPQAPYNSGNPNFYKYNVWGTGPLPAKVNDPDRFAEAKGICPVEGGTILHIVDFPPEPKDAAEKAHYFEIRRKDLSSRPKAPGLHYDHESEHVGMHITDTIDYAIIMSGEIYAVMDAQESLMKAGDVLVQRGTNHTWSNRSDAPCRVAFVLVSGEPA
ncbi:cupin domain-containing protein [Pelagibacterium lacus]|uniref:cupin domain-containing protein n=1 Tax=Pelagibacterium lacus TaxID=2282655 RepID=UPI0011C06A85|nr:cupin domain-containing protein [Pelagibacterium lacus]